MGRRWEIQLVWLLLSLNLFPYTCCADMKGRLESTMRVSEVISL